MQTFEFDATLDQDKQFRLPDDVAKKLLAGGLVRVVLVEDPDEDEDWRRLTTERFFEGYDDGDDIYDQLFTR